MEAKQRLPRLCQEVPNKYISSFIGFAPADDPQILGMCVIYNPTGSLLRRDDCSSGDRKHFREYHSRILALKKSRK